MSVFSAHEIALSHDCIIPQCPREATGDDGLCDHCRKAGRTGTATSDVIEIHRGRKNVPQFTCETRGCNNTVKTNKGTGAHCVEVQPNGKTHRQEWMEEKRRVDPNFMKRTVSGRSLIPPPSRAPVPVEPRPFPPGWTAKGDDPDDDVIIGNESASLLDQIADATKAVKQAQSNLRACEKYLTKLMRKFLDESEKPV